MLTMEAIRAKNYKIFDNSLGAEILQRQDSSLKYIENLAHLSDTNISSWEIMSVFGNNEGQLPRERNKINEIFFAYKESLKNQPQEPSPLPEDTDKQVNALCFKFDQTFSKRLDQVIKDQEKLIINDEQNVHKYMTEVKNRQEALARNLALKEGLLLKKKTGIGIATDLKKVLAEGWWRLSDDQTPNRLSLLTTNIVLTYQKQKAAISQAVPMGIVQVDLYIDGQNIYAKCKPYDANPIYGSHCHPHIGSSGEVCLGNMATAFAAAQKSFSIIDILEIIKKCLTIYNPESPYVGLHNFEEQYNRGNLFRRYVYLEKEAAIRKVFNETRFNPLPEPLAEAPEADDSDSEPDYEPIEDDSDENTESSDEYDPENDEEDVSF